MHHKTKLLTERVCHQCQNEHHLLYFRFIEHTIVYFFAKCTKCNYSYRQNCSFEKWKSYIEEHEQIQQLTKHHRIPQSHPNSSNESWNISLVPLKKHQSYHTLFSNDNVYKIAEKLNRIWIDPRFKLVVEKRTEYETKNNFLLTPPKN